MEKINKCVYTAITGNYDDLKEPDFITPGWDYICYTNNSKLRSGIWKIKYIDNNGLDDVRLSRSVWALNHKYVPEYKISISIGGQMKIIGNLDIFLKKYLPNDNNIDMSMAKHPNRICIYEEAKRCKKRDDPKLIERQMRFYREEGYPQNNGLVATGIIIRKHGRSNVEEHCQKWWEQIKKWSFRDQLSFDYVLWKYKLVNISYFSYNIIRGKGGFFKKFPHKKKE